MNAVRIPLLRCVAGVLLLALVPALLSAWLHPRKPSWERTGEVALSTVAGWADVLWIDARPATAYSEAHVPGALNLPSGAWESHIETVLIAWAPERRVVVYCDGHSCRASHEVAARMRTELGLENVHVLTGGWDAWRQAGREVVK